ncbi:MAG: hypothetical protein AAGJ35_09615 [Myxococcota bacterium]
MHVHQTLPTQFWTEFPWKLLACTGPDQEKFLSGLVTNVVKGLAPGTSNLSLILTVKGRIISEILLVREAERFSIWAPPQCEEQVWKHFDHYHIIEDIELSWDSTTEALVLSPALATQHGLPELTPGTGQVWTSIDPALWVTHVQPQPTFSALLAYGPAEAVAALRTQPGLGELWRGMGDGCGQAAEA